MNIREISDVFKDTANQITAIKSYNFGWASDRTRSTNTEDYQELNEFPRVFFSVPTITGSDQTRKQDTYQVTIFFDDLLGYNNEGDADLTLQIDKWAALQEYANYFVQRLNKVKQSILPNYLFIPEAPSITFDSFTGLQRMITVQLSFTLVVPTNCEPIVSTLIECIANIITSSNLTASITRIIKLVSTLQASSSLNATALVSKLPKSNLNTESSLAANIQLAKLPSSSLNAGGTLVGNAFITRLFAASLNGNGSIFANPLITNFTVSSLNGGASLNASALVSKLPASSLTGAGTLAAELTVTGSALLLDTYPNAAAAYSLRKLRTAYAGSAIRVRRSIDNTEQDIGFDVNGNLNTVALLAFCGVGNGFVATWYDQSGNARNVTQTTAAAQPLIYNNGNINTNNGKPSVYFDGSNDVLVLNSFTVLSVLSNFTVVIATKVITPTNSKFIFNVALASTNNRVNLTSDGRYTLLSSATFGKSISIPSNSNNLFFVENIPQNLYKNNVLATGTLSNTGGNDTRFTIGGIFTSTTLNAEIDLQEFIVYPVNQNTNRDNIQNNINTHYAIY